MIRKLYLLFFVIHLVICNLQFIISSLSAQNKTLDSIHILLNKDRDACPEPCRGDTNKVNHLNALCWEYKNISSYDNAFRYGNAALQLARQLNFKKGIAASYNNIGVFYKKQGNYEKALENHFASLKISGETGDKRGTASSYNNIGIIYDEHGNYEKALENYLAALKINKEIGDKHRMAASYNNIAIIYSEQGNNAKSLENFSTSLKIREEIGDKKGIADSYNNIGEIYFEQGNLSRQRKNLAQAYRIYDKALKNYLTSLKIREEIGDKEGIAASYSNLGNIYLAQNNYARAITYLQKSLRLFKETGVKDGIRDAYQKLSEANEKMNDYKNAYKYHQLYSQIKDTLFNEKSSKQMAEMQTKYETEKKEKENNSLIQQNLFQQAAIQKREQGLIVLICILVFTIIISLLLYNRYTLKQQALMKHELNRQQELRLKAIIETQEKERNRIAQDLHDGAGQLLSGLKFSLQNLSREIMESQPSLKDTLTAQNKIIDETVTEVRSIAHQMTPQALSKAGLVAALEDMLNKTFSGTKIQYKFIHPDCLEKFEKNIEIGLYRITQELANNILKHSSATEVSILLMKNNNELLLMVEDNGRGFDFEEYKNKGMGLMNIISRTASMNGNVDFDTGHNGGTLAAIKIPLT